MDFGILVVESQSEDVLFLQELFSEIESAPQTSISQPHLTVEYASDWSTASQMLLRQDFRAVLLNPYLADCRGAETYRRCKELAPQTAVALLLDDEDVSLARSLLREGAQEYLIKPQTDCTTLARSIYNAVDRHRLLAAARTVAMVDLLTGLLTPTAFLLLAERDLRLAGKLDRRVMVILAEPGPRSQSHGGTETLDRDLALVHTAERLRTLAGTTDLIARLDHNRLAMTIVDTDGEIAEEAWARLHTASIHREIALGAAIFDPRKPVRLTELLERAERDLKPSAEAAATP